MRTSYAGDGFLIGTRVKSHRKYKTGICKLGDNIKAFKTAAPPHILPYLYLFTSKAVPLPP
jgi:hypothetical protein